MVFSNHFGFTEQPFSNTPDPKYFFPTGTHQEALTALAQGITERKGFLMLTGDVGTGKTTVCRTLLTRLQDEEIETALVLNPDLSETEILATIARDFGLEDRTASRFELMGLLYHRFAQRARVGGNSLIVIDDAQNLPLRSLEQVRMISNFETDKEKLVQILLVGQPELAARLLTPDFRQVKQRIAVRAHLSPLSAKETREYILHRLAKAGAPPGTVTFTEQALVAIFRESRGYPRSINTLCDQSLSAAQERKTDVIDVKLVDDRVQALRMRLPLRARLAARRRAIGLGAAAACAAAAAVVALQVTTQMSTATPAAKAPDPALQVKLAQVESGLAGLEKRLNLLRASPDVADSLLRQSAELEKNLVFAREDAHRLGALLRQKDGELRALQTRQAGTSGSAEAAPASEAQQSELRAEFERVRAESRSRSEQIRHLEKALQTLKTRLSDAERQREELSRSLQEQERLVASPGDGGGPAPALGGLQAENEQLRRSNQLLERIAQQTIQAQNREIETLLREKEQTAKRLDAASPALASSADSVAAAR